MVVQDLLQEEILPDLVKLEFPVLIFIVYCFIEEQPELFEVLKAILKLLVRPHDHVEGLLVLLLAVNEALEACAGVLDVAPSASLALLADELVALAILEVHLLLLLESNMQLGVQASR